MFVSQHSIRLSPSYRRKATTVKAGGRLLATLYAWLLAMAGVVSLSYTAHAQQPPPLPPNQLVLPAGQHVVPLHWQGDSTPYGWEPHAALLIPVRLPGVNRTFYMQFDTGSPYTLFYRTEIESLLRQYPALTGLKPTGDTLHHVRLKAGTLSFTVKTAPVRQLNSDSSINKQAPVIIGTLGTDLLENKVAHLDYSNQQLILSDTISQAEKQAATWSSFVFAGRRILLPATLKGKQTLLYFDSGSSAFPLLTDKATCLLLATDTLHPVRYPVQSWNATLTANTVASEDSISLAGIWLPLKQVTWMEGASQSQVAQMARIGIGGMTGNKLFSNNCLLLDTRNKQFAILKGCARYSPSSP